MKLEKDSSRIGVLVLIAAGLGIYHILTAVLCHRDCGFYVRFAQGFETGFSSVFADKRFGYPLMIFAMHKITALFSDPDSLYGWIYSAQITSLICRLLAIIPLYYIAKRFLKSEFVFPAMLIIIMLPYPAKFGADIIRTWPFFMFIIWSVFLLIKGFEDGKIWCLILSGLICGTGYFVRPEMVQIILYMLMFGVINMAFKKFEFSRMKTAIIGLVFILMFSALAYMYYQKGGSLMPSKLQALIENKLQNEWGKQSSLLHAGGALLEGISENSFWFFTPFAFLGLIDAMRKKSSPKPSMVLFMASFLTLNTLILILLHLKYGYIERRHTMPLTLFLCLFVPRGIDVLSIHLSRFLKRDKREFFKVLTAVGLIICFVKIIEPMEHEKRHYVKGIEWLRANVEEGELVIVEDPRIGFYSQTNYMHLSTLKLDRKADYVVITDRSDEISFYPYDVKRRAVFEADDERGRPLEIYEVLE